MQDNSDGYESFSSDAIKNKKFDDYLRLLNEMLNDPKTPAEFVLAFRPQDLSGFSFCSD